MQGMNAQTGQLINGIPYLRQRIENALSTPVNSTVMHRERGSRLFALVDEPMTQATIVDTYAAIAECLQRPVSGVPDFRLNKVRAVQVGEGGSLLLDLEGEYLPEGKAIRLEGILV
jgi:phage baseplate assembly protein W